MKKRPAPSALERARQRILRLINSSLEIEKVIQLSMQLLERTVGAEASSVLLHDPASGKLRFYAATGAKRDALRVMEMPADRGIAGRAFQSGRAVRVSSARRSPHFYGEVDDKTHFTTRDLIAVPIRTEGRVIGVLEVLNKAQGSFTPADLAEVRALAEEVAVALENARLHDEIRRAYLESMLNMARAERLRDRDTGLHIDRCGEYAVRLAPDLGFAANEIENLRLAVMMHDIGKVAIPDAVLLKPGRLDAAELVVMQSHALRGAEILGAAPDLRRAAEVAAGHHEKWDGSGYPRGLRGEAIPLPARLTAIIDVFDALSSKRPYKEPFPPEQVASMLREGSGSHFDPEICALFLGRLEEMREVFASLS